jgi:hypothetical protein
VIHTDRNVIVFKVFFTKIQGVHDRLVEFNLLIMNK